MKGRRILISGMGEILGYRSDIIESKVSVARVAVCIWRCTEVALQASAVLLLHVAWRYLHLECLTILISIRIVVFVAASTIIVEVENPFQSRYVAAPSDSTVQIDDRRIAFLLQSGTRTTRPGARSGPVAFDFSLSTSLTGSHHCHIHQPRSFHDCSGNSYL